MTDSAQVDMQIHPCADAEAVAQFAATAIAARGVFHWVLAGGTTPKRCYELLRDADLGWSNVYVWFGDERCLPVGDTERNDLMANDALLNHVPVPAAQIHRIDAELGPEVAAEHYAALLADAPRMDLILLGIGEDGHTASLFPGNPALDDPAIPAIPGTQYSIIISRTHFPDPTLNLCTAIFNGQSSLRARDPQAWNPPLAHHRK